MGHPCNRSTGRFEVSHIIKFASNRISQIFQRPNEFQRSGSNLLPSQISIDASAVPNPFSSDYRLLINGSVLDVDAFYRPITTTTIPTRLNNNLPSNSTLLTAAETTTTRQTAPLTTYSQIKTSACHVTLFNVGLLFGSNLILYILHV